MKNLILTICVLFAYTSLLSAGEGHKGHYEHAEHSLYGKFAFMQNHGQWDGRVLFKAEVPSGYLYLERDRFTYHLFNAAIFEEIHHGHVSDIEKLKVQHHVFHISFKNALPISREEVEGHTKFDHYMNFYLGKDRSKWRSKVPVFADVHYQKLYPNIDLHMYSIQHQLKYDFVVSPGGNPANIELQYEGIDRIKLKNGNLEYKTALGEISEQKPYAYQVINGEKVSIPCRYILKKELSVGFEIGDYDTSLPLIIDPVLIFSTYSGSTSNNFGYTATFDSEGFLYSGSTAFGASGSYPTTTGAFQTTFKGGDPAGGIGGSDIAITKYDTSGTKRIYSTLLGGSGDEQPHSLVVNSRDELYVMGTTGSRNFPVTSNAYDTSFNNPTNHPRVNASGLGLSFANGLDLIVSKFSTDGSSLLASTYIGGVGNDGFNNSPSLRYNYADEVRGEIDIDRNDHVYVATTTSSVNFPIVGSVFQPTYASGSQDGVIVKLGAALNGIMWSSYIGGSREDAVYSLAINDSLDIYVTGGTNSATFPTTNGSFQPNFQPSRANGFIAKISQNGQSLLHSTFFGSDNYDQLYFVEVDNRSNVYVLGQTEDSTTNFIKNALYNQPRSGQVVSKLDPTLDSLIWSTTFGTSSPVGVRAQPNISPTAFLVDLCNAIYISGWGGTTNFSGTNNNTTSLLGLPTTTDAYQRTTDGSDFYLTVLSDDVSQLKYASFFGGSAAEHVDGGTSRFDRKGKIYQSVCAGCRDTTTNFPSTPGAVSPSNKAAPGCNNAVFKMDFNLPIVVSDFQIPFFACIGDTVFMDNNSLEQKYTEFYWDFGNGDTSTSREPYYVFNTPGNYVVTLVLSDTSTCNLSDTSYKEINVVQPIGMHWPTVHVCYGDSAQIGQFSSGKSIYQWVPTSGLSNPNAPFPYATPKDTTDYTLYIYNGVCVDTGYQTVSVDSSVTATFADVAGCVDDSVAFNFTGNHWLATKYKWYFGDGDSSTLKNPKHKYAQKGNYIVELIVTDSLACNFGDTIGNGVRIEKDTSYVLPLEKLCPGESTFSPVVGDPAKDYRWFPTTGVQDTNRANSRITPIATTNYLLTAGFSSCEDSIILPLRVDSVLEASIDTANPKCAPVNVSFTNLTDTTIHTKFDWDYGNGATSQLFEDSTTYTQKGSYQITLIVTDTSTCNERDTVDTYITIESDTSFVIDSLLLCNGASKKPNLSLENGNTYRWSTQNGLSDSTIYNPEVTSTSNRTYTVHIDDGVCVDTATLEVSVDTIAIAAPNDTSVCSDANFIPMQANSFGTSVWYSWTELYAPQDTLNTNRSDSNVNIPTQLLEATYIISSRSGLGCVASDSVTVTVADMGVSVSDSQNICLFDTVYLAVNSELANDTLSAQWTPTADIIGRSDLTNIQAIPDRPGYFVANTTNTIGCVREDSIYVYVSQLADYEIKLTTDKDTVLKTEGTNIHLELPAGMTYTWESVSSLQGDGTDPMVTPQQTTTYTVTVSDPNLPECNATKSVSVAVFEVICGEPEIFVPNLFTPNSDGQNDVLFVRGRWIEEIKFQVYNRWGEEVFVTEDKSFGWDGMYDNELALPDVYKYHLKVQCADGQTYETKGDVTLLR